MWRATDTHPEHEVAVKVLPEAFGQEPAKLLPRALQVARTVQALLNTLNLRQLSSILGVPVRQIQAGTLQFPPCVHARPVT